MKALIYAAAALCVGLSFASCDDDDDDYFDSGNQGRQISVSRVFLEDCESSVPDREVSFARVGQMIRLEGSGFYGMKKVYINGYDTYFNRAYVSDNSMLVTINAKTPVTDADADVRDKIRLVKDKTETTVAFTIRAASPAVSGMSCTLPTAGETVFVYGENLHEVKSVTLPDGQVLTEGLASDDKDGEWFSFVMPAECSAGGHVYFEGANGQGATPPYFNYVKGMILNFDGTGAQGSWGSSNKDDEGNIKAGVSMVYPEDLVDDPAQTGRGLCAPIVPKRLLDEGGVASGKPRATEIWTAGNDDAADDWGRMVTGDEFITAETPAAELAFQFDVYAPDAWSGTGYVEVLLINNYNFAGIGSDDDRDGNYTAFCVPWVEDGEVVPFKTDGWRTVTIPFSSITAEEVKPSVSGVFGGLFDKTFQDIVDARNSASYRNFGMGFVNTDFEMGSLEVVSEKFTGPSVYVDNWRVVNIKGVTISDYPEPTDN